MLSLARDGVIALHPLCYVKLKSSPFAVSEQLPWLLPYCRHTELSCAVGKSMIWLLLLLRVTPLITSLQRIQSTRSRTLSKQQASDTLSKCTYSGICAEEKKGAHAGSTGRLA